MSESHRPRRLCGPLPKLLGQRIHSSITKNGAIFVGRHSHRSFTPSTGRTGGPSKAQPLQPQPHRIICASFFHRCKANSHRLRCYQVSPRSLLPIELGRVLRATVHPALCSYTSMAAFIITKLVGVSNAEGCVNNFASLSQLALL